MELLSGVTKDGQEIPRTAENLVRFDDASNVQVYVRLAPTNEAALQQVRDTVEWVEIEGPEYGLVQAWVDPDNLNALANLVAVKRAPRQTTGTPIRAPAPPRATLSIAPAWCAPSTA